jgi:hypothetical protein
MALSILTSGSEGLSATRANANRLPTWTTSVMNNSVTVPRPGST